MLGQLKYIVPAPRSRRRLVLHSECHPHADVLRSSVPVQGWMFASEMWLFARDGLSAAAEANDS